MKQILNPFPVTGYLGPDYFCDRATESARLINYITNGNSTTLVAQRRIGKTALIQHVFQQLPNGWKGIYIDILETENLNQFLNKMASSILHSLPEKSNWGDRFLDFVRKLRPTFSFDQLSGSPQLSFELKPYEVEQSIDSILNYLENQELKVVIAIDEFQQILNYPEKNTDAWLRTRIQKMHNVFFIFSGSQQHLMSELFFSPSRPFYYSTVMMKLEKIDKETYAQFIVAMFERFNKKMPIEVAYEILEWTNVHTFYVQQLCNRVFSVAAQQVDSEIWKQEAIMLLQEQEPFFYTLRNMLTRSQWNLLKSIAAEHEVYQPTSKAFLDKYKLGTSATVLRALQTLIDKELILSLTDVQGKQYYSVYDVLLQRWAT